MAGKPNKPIESAKGPIGRPSKFTPERCAAIVDAIRKRVPYEYAAEGNGICEDTLYEWIKIGKAHRKEEIDSEYASFSEAIKRAEMERIIEHTDNIAGHVDKWQGDAWILERRWYKHYGSNAQLNELNHRLSQIERTPNETSSKERSSEDDKKI